MTDTMRIGVLASPRGWHFRDLVRAAGDRHQVVDVQFETLAAALGHDRNFGLDFECVVVRVMPAGSLQQIIFRMDLLGQLAAAGTLVVNPPRTIETAVDKFLSLSMLQNAGLPIPETRVSQTLQHALVDYETLGGDVVVKPIFGSMGHGLERISDQASAKARFADLIARGEVIYQQPFIDHGGTDLRLLVIGDTVLGMRREHPGQWITNISRGGAGFPHEPTSLEQELARCAASCLGATIAGVDLVYPRLDSGGSRPCGEPKVLEVNASPGWEATSQVLGIDVGQLMIEEFERLFRERKDQ